MTIQTIDTCSLHGEIPGRMMLFHMRHAVILFLETSLSLTETEVRLCKGVQRLRIGSRSELVWAW